MCGICGIIDFQGHLSKDKRSTLVRRMNNEIIHRGPDESGFFEDNWCSLAMRRLSIIDLSNGQQPIYNETGDIGVVYNGEIYNFKELKSSLQTKGHHFKTNTDTEVLVHLYEEYGDAMLPMLKGMFVFCLYDQKRRQFLLARDRFGEKPLFYFHKPKYFSFSSELKSLLEDPHVPKQLDLNALNYYLRTSLVPEPLTLFKDIKSLPAGHYVKIEEYSYQIKKYFHLAYEVDNDIKTEADAIDLIKPLLIQAVKRQSISDVPIGAFLSGGIDSSTVVALLQKHSDQPIQTFTAKFENQRYDESSIAKEVAIHCGTDHHELLIPNYDFEEDIFWKIIDHVGVPFRDSSAIPTYLITQQIRKHVKVALSGDGGDELFGGYDIFQWHDKILGLKGIPSLIRQSGLRFLSLAQTMPGLNKISRFRQLKRAVQTSLESKEKIPIALNEMFADFEIQEGIGAMASGDYELLQHYPKASKDWSNLRRIMYYRCFHTLPSNMLIKVDRMSMANSLEVRAPFLDPDLFEASTKLPDQFLINKGLGKHLIRRIMKDELPASVFDHPKQGFSIPLHDYQNEAFRNLAKRLIFQENPFPGLFDSSFLEKTYKLGVERAKSNAQKSVFQSSHQLWMLMQLFGWGSRFKVSL